MKSASVHFFILNYIIVQKCYIMGPYSSKTNKMKFIYLENIFIIYIF